MELLQMIKSALDKVRATDVKIYDLRGFSPLADYTVLATIDVIRQANASIEYLETLANKNGARLRSIEGKGSTWLLVDLNDVILHIFTKDERANFDLDKLFVNCNQIDYESIEVPGDGK